MGDSVDVWLHKIVMLTLSMQMSKINLFENDGIERVKEFAMSIIAFYYIVQCTYLPMNW